MTWGERREVSRSAQSPARARCLQTAAGDSPIPTTAPIIPTPCPQVPPRESHRACGVPYTHHPPANSPYPPARGCHRNGTTSGRDRRPSLQPDVAGPPARRSRGSREAGGDGRGAGDTPGPAPRWLLLAPAHSPAPADGWGSPSPPASAARRCPAAHSRLPRPSVASRVGTGRDEDGISHQLQALPAAPTTPRPLPRSPGLTQQHLSPPAQGCPWAQGDARVGGAEKGKAKGSVSPHRCVPGGGEDSGWSGTRLALRLCGLTAALPGQTSCSSLLPRDWDRAGWGCMHPTERSPPPPRVPVPQPGSAPHLTPSLGVPSCPGGPLSACGEATRSR